VSAQAAPGRAPLSRIGAPVRGLAVAVVVAVLLVAGQMFWTVPGAVVAGGALVVGLAVPVSAELSRRASVVLLVGLGLAPALWAWRWPGDSLTRVGGLVALVAGGLAGWVAAGDPTGGGAAARARRLVPRVRGTDLVATAGVAAVLAYLAPLLRPRGPQDTMAFVLDGWDHVGHFDMVAMIRHGGSLIPLQAQTQGSSWWFDSYPQGFHAAAAAALELLAGVGTGTPRPADLGEVAGYVQASTLVYAAGLAAVVTTVCGLTSLRRRPARAAVAVAALFVTWLVSPGGVVMHQAGFANFVLGCVGAACLPLLAAQTPRLGLNAPVLGMAGALLLAAHNWLLLLPMAGVGVLVALWPLRRSRLPRGRGSAIGLAVLVLATAAGGLAAVAQVFSGRGADHVLVDGGFPAHNLAGYVVPIVLAFLVWGFVWWAGADPTRPHRRAGRWVLGIAPILVGLATFGWLARAQFAATGHLGYYGIKLLTGVMLVSLTYAVALATLPIRAVARAGAIRWFRPLAWGSVCLALLVTTVLPIVRQRTDFPSVRVRLTWAASPAPRMVEQTQVEQHMLAVTGIDRPTFFLPGEGLDSGTAAHLNLWQLAVRGHWTTAAEHCWQGGWKIVAGEYVSWGDLHDTAVAAREALACDPGLGVAIPAATSAQTRAELAPVGGRLVLDWAGS